MSLLFHGLSNAVGTFFWYLFWYGRHGKLPYLIGDGADRKLKRNVPPELQPLTKKWAWVERLRGKTAEDVKRQTSSAMLQKAIPLSPYTLSSLSRFWLR